MLPVHSQQRKMASIWRIWGDDAPPDVQIKFFEKLRLFYIIAGCIGGIAFAYVLFQFEEMNQGLLNSLLLFLVISVAINILYACIYFGYKINILKKRIENPNSYIHDSRQSDLRQSHLQKMMSTGFFLVDYSCPFCNSQLYWIERYKNYYCTLCEVYPWNCRYCGQKILDFNGDCPGCGKQVRPEKSITKRGIRFFNRCVNVLDRILNYSERRKGN